MLLHTQVVYRNGYLCLLFLEGEKEEGIVLNLDAFWGHCLLTTFNCVLSKV